MSFSCDGIWTEDHAADQLTLHVDPLQDAIWWRDENPEAFAYFLAVARDDMERGFHPSSDFCGHMVRRSGLLTRQAGSPVVFNDHLTSSLARLCKLEYGIPFATRRARGDDWPAP
jgi:hypothetical protein